MRPLSELLASLEANERACARRQKAFARLSLAQRDEAIDHLMAIEPGRDRVFIIEEILGAHLALRMEG